MMNIRAKHIHDYIKQKEVVLLIFSSNDEYLEKLKYYIKELIYKYRLSCIIVGWFEFANNYIVPKGITKRTVFLTYNDYVISIINKPNQEQLNKFYQECMEIISKENWEAIIEEKAKKCDLLGKNVIKIKIKNKVFNRQIKEPISTTFQRDSVKEKLLKSPTSQIMVKPKSDDQQTINEECKFSINPQNNNPTSQNILKSIDKKYTDMSTSSGGLPDLKSSSNISFMANNSSHLINQHIKKMIPDSPSKQAKLNFNHNGKKKKAYSCFRSKDNKMHIANLKEIALEIAQTQSFGSIELPVSKSKPSLIKSRLLPLQFQSSKVYGLKNNPSPMVELRKINVSAPQFPSTDRKSSYILKSNNLKTEYSLERNNKEFNYMSEVLDLSLKNKCKK